jgi:transposase-like protein
MVARNFVQLQKGMSEADFDHLYGTEEQCRDAIFRWRWSKGFVCPACGSTKHCIVGTRGLYQCGDCHTQTSLTAGTIFHSTKLPFKTWFRAIYHITQTKGGISSIELARRLGVTQNTAWKISHKFMQVMLEREKEKPLRGRVEMDDAYIGGKRKGGKRGRGASGKIPFLAAVETTDDGRPHRMKLQKVSGFGRNPLSLVIPTLLHDECDVVTDGLACFREISRLGIKHTPIVTSHNKTIQDTVFKWVNTVLSNVKSAMTGTYKSLQEKHISRYFASFAYRFNRRYDLSSMFARFAYVALRTAPMPYRLLKLAEDNA